jgi:hypothetical protein
MNILFSQWFKARKMGVHFSRDAGFFLSVPHPNQALGPFQCMQAVLSLVEQLAIHTLVLILSHEYMVLPSPSYIFP